MLSDIKTLFNQISSIGDQENGNSSHQVSSNQDLEIGNNCDQILHASASLFIINTELLLIDKLTRGDF